MTQRKTFAGGGTSRKMDADTIAQCLRLRAEGMSIYDIAEVVGFTGPAVWRHVKRAPDPMPGILVRYRNNAMRKGVDVPLALLPIYAALRAEAGKKIT